MKSTFCGSGRFFLALLAMGGIAFAEESGVDAQFKFRMGYGLASKDELTRRALGIGFNLGYSTSMGRFSAEVGYQYKPGNQFRFDYSTAPRVAGTTLDHTYSGDLRRNSLEGLSLRLGYEKSINEDWAIRAGAQLFGTRFRQEYLGNVAYGAGPIVDSYNGAVTESGRLISPFVGVNLKATESSHFEIGVLGLAYKTIHYVHVAGTGTADGQNNALDRTEKRNRMVPHLEVAYVFQF